MVVHEHRQCAGGNWHNVNICTLNNNPWRFLDRASTEPLVGNTEKSYENRPAGAGVPGAHPDIRSGLYPLGA